ncbi:CBS domain-containing protein [Sphingomonadaceae bacterium]|nr:CBS domain-containing protein [Sphingomonadaceae bacterium]
MNIAQLIASRPASDVLFCDVDMTMSEAIAIIAGKRIGALPVIEAGEVVGIFSERDVIYRVADIGAKCLESRVGDVMTAPPITVSPDTSVDEALSLMTKRRIRHLPVVDGTAMCGFISIGDLVKSRMDQVESEAQAMRSYITTG